MSNYSDHLFQPLDEGFSDILNKVRSSGIDPNSVKAKLIGDNRGQAKSASQIIKNLRSGVGKVPKLAAANA